LKKIALNEAQKFERDACLTHEYPFYALNIDACYARVTGRNPVSGFEYNEESTEVVFIIAGSGEISTGGGYNIFYKGRCHYDRPNGKILLDRGVQLRNVYFR